MPPLLNGFLEQVFRPGFAAQRGEAGKMWKTMLSGRSAHVIITMGMPGFVYRWFFGAHSLKSLKRNILNFSRIAPLRATLIGPVDAMSDAKRRRWQEKLRKLGHAAR